MVFQILKVSLVQKDEPMKTGMKWDTDSTVSLLLSGSFSEFSSTPQTQTPSFNTVPQVLLLLPTILLLLPI